MTRKLLIVVNHAGFFLSHRLPVALAAQSAGYEVHIATPMSKHVARIQENGLLWHPIRLVRSRLNPVGELVSILDLVRLYRRLKPQIVHHVTPKPVLYGTIAARFSGIPAVVNAISGMGYAFSGKASWTQFTLKKLLALVYRSALRHPRMKLIFQNREQEGLFIRQRWARPGEAVMIPGSGVDTATFRPVEKPPRIPNILLASRMIDPKGLKEFVEASSLMKSQGIAARFMLVGEPDPDNPLSTSLAQLQEWHRAGLVEYQGRREDMVAVFAEADIFCLPSYYSEGVPKALIEAAACGIPAVTTDWPGCRDVVQDGVSGFLVPVHDADAVARTLTRLVHDPCLRKQYGAAARERAVRYFSLQTVVQRTLDTYADLLA